MFLLLLLLGCWALVSVIADPIPSNDGDDYMVGMASYDMYVFVVDHLQAASRRSLTLTFAVCHFGCIRLYW
jgi:hypothetical protein